MRCATPRRAAPRGLQRWCASCVALTSAVRRWSVVVQVYRGGLRRPLHPATKLQNSRGHDPRFRRLLLPIPAGCAESRPADNGLVKTGYCRAFGPAHVAVWRHVRDHSVTTEDGI